MSAHINLAFLDEGDEDSKFSDIFDFNHVIGSGSFGTVISARMKSDHQNYAVKVNLLFLLLLQDYQEKADQQGDKSLF
jgi:hypothetical protein